MNPSPPLLRLLYSPLCALGLVASSCHSQKQPPSVDAPPGSTQSAETKRQVQWEVGSAPTDGRSPACEFLARVPSPQTSVHWSPRAKQSTVGYLENAGDHFDIVEQPAERHLQQRYAHCGPLNARHKVVPEVLDHDCGNGRSCLRFEGFEHDAGGCPSDRLELVLSHGDEVGALTFGETRHLRFALHVPSHTVDSGQRVLISQIWQHQFVRGGPMHEVGPPFFIAVASHPDPERVHLDFAYRSDASQVAVTFLREELQLDAWAVFHVRIRPSFEGEEGTILVWRETDDHSLSFTENEALNYDPDSTDSYRFHWGYTPSPQTKIGSTFSIRIGMYRPAPTQRFGVWFDQVQLGAVPEGPPHLLSDCWKLDNAIPATE